MKYVSEDGKVFDTVEACEAYENELKVQADARKEYLLQQAKDLKEVKDAKRHYEDLLKAFNEKYRPEEKAEEEAPRRKATVQMTFFDDCEDECDFFDEDEEDEDYEEDCSDCDCDDCEGYCCHECNENDAKKAMDELAELFRAVFL